MLTLRKCQWYTLRKHDEGIYCLHFVYLWTEAISDQRSPHRNPCSDETGLEDKVGVCGPNTDVIFIVCLIS